MLSALADRVAATPFAEWAAQSPYAYPGANVVHVLGVVMLVGSIGLVDLRVLGAFRSLPLRALYAALTPLMIAGLLLMAASGSVLFASDAEALAKSPVFRLKLSLIGLALLNALAFRLFFQKLAEQVPPLARIMTLASLLLWLSVAVAGRLIAYL